MRSALNIGKPTEYRKKIYEKDDFQSAEVWSKWGVGEQRKKIMEKLMPGCYLLKKKWKTTQ